MSQGPFPAFRAAVSLGWEFPSSKQQQQVESFTSHLFGATLPPPSSLVRISRWPKGIRPIGSSFVINNILVLFPVPEIAPEL